MTLAGPTMELRWLPREAPLSPCAVAATGDAARRLARRLLAYEDAEMALLEGVAERETLVVLGYSDALPWAEGVVYLGHDSEAPSLLLPTALRPDFPAALLERAVRRQFPTAASPVALLPQSRQVLSMASARPVARKQIEAWLEGKL